MKKYEIVKEHKEFDDIIANGRYVKNKYFIIYNNESNYSYPRFGIAVGKKVGNAVTRNKFKRQIRMIINNNKNLFKNNQDYIIIVKKSSLDLTYTELNDNLVELLK